MAGICKPNVEGINDEIEYKLLGSESHIYSPSSYSIIEIKDAGKYLFDGKIDNNNNVMAYREKNDYVEIEISHRCNLWSYTNNNNGRIKIFKQIDDVYVDVSGSYKQNIGEKYKWSKLIENLDKGIYKLMGGTWDIYNEWYLENINDKKYIIKQNNLYYTIKSSYYNEDKVDTTLILLSNGFSDIDKAISDLSDIDTNKIPNENYNIIKIVK